LFFFFFGFHVTRSPIAKELKITPVSERTQEYKRNWIKHVHRMAGNRLHRIIKTARQKAEGTRKDH
jgi:hypothetical protein